MAISVSMAFAALAKESSIADGIWVWSNAFSAASSWGCRDSSGSWYFVMKRSDGEIEDCCTRSWIHQRHRHSELIVDAVKLTEVGELIRSGDVARRRKERVLDDRS